MMRRPALWTPLPDGHDQPASGSRASAYRGGIRGGLVLSAIALLTASGREPLRAQSPDAEGHADAPLAIATAISGPIRIDGRSDEAAWRAAVPIVDFIQVDPAEGAPVSQPTEVRILFDPEALYVAARLGDTAPISSRLARRDQPLSDSDWFIVALDSYHDHRSASRFRVNPSGVRIDESVLTGGDDSPSWDPVWEVATAVTPEGWSVEMRIPFNQLRFSGQAAQIWGLQLERVIAARQERAVFAFTPKSLSGGVARYGHLEGLSGIRQRAGVELAPYASLGSHFRPAATPSGSIPDPFRNSPDYSGSAGLDLKVRVTSDFTLEGTANPDFGQIEADPAVLNLTQYEVRFAEKRPFFIEGAGIFEFGEGTELLYTRRLGAGPRWSAPGDAIHEEVPSQQTILGAAKLTGRSANGWSIGLLDVIAGTEHGRYLDASGVEHREQAAPMANYAVMRIGRSTEDDRFSFGVIATAVNRRLSAGRLAQLLPGSAYVGGIDFRRRWADNEWSLSGHLAGSRLSGSPAAMLRLQNASARYLGRPDADHLELNPAAQTLSGYSANLRLTKQAGLHWRGRAQIGAVSPGFEINDAGFQQMADRVTPHLRVIYVEERPGRWLRQWSVSGGPDATWNTGGDHLGSSLSLEANAELLSYWGGELRLDRSVAGLDDRLTRGGPFVRGLSSTRAYLSINSDGRKWWAVEPQVEYRADEAGGSLIEAGVGLDLRPAEAWSFSLRPHLSREREDAHYLHAVTDELAIATFGRRYLFADLEQTTVGLETRLNLTFRPDLSFELYAQPFIGSGTFGTLKELRMPRTYSFLTYGRDAGTVVRDGSTQIVDPDGDGAAPAFVIEDGDFTTRSLRGNAVLRWEWRPGSTLFLVWQQTRAGTASTRGLDFDDQVRELFELRPDNVFMLKLTYWFGR